MSAPASNLIHVAQIFDQGAPRYLFLRKIDAHRFEWFDDSNKSISISAANPEEAIRLAWREWNFKHFRPLGCGYRYTLPERDEHGTPATFSQMALSLANPTGTYYDPDLGHNCIVNLIPTTTRALYDTLKAENKL